MTIREAVSNAALIVFPATPDLDAFPVAWWPDEDWRSFVALAVDLGVKILYAESVVFDEGDLD